jgi:ligand-binding sensor domain-containing protein
LVGLQTLFDALFTVRKRPCRCLLLVGLLAPSCKALDSHKKMTQYVQTTLAGNGGLPQSSVNAMAQTADGYMWFATEEGIARYDGVRAVTYDVQQNKALRDNFINALAASRDGGLWVGTRSGLTYLKNHEYRSLYSGAISDYRHP